MDTSAQSVPIPTTSQTETPTRSPRETELQEEVEALQAEMIGRPAADYGWTYDYAAKAYEETARNVEYVDAKAEKFLGAIGVGVTILVAASSRLSLATPIKEFVGICSLAAALFIIYAVWKAVEVLHARKWRGFPLISQALRYVSYYHDRRTDTDGPDRLGKAAFVAELHRTREALRDLQNEKGDALAQAQSAVIGALISLALIALAVISSHIFG